MSPALTTVCEKAFRVTLLLMWSCVLYETLQSTFLCCIHWFGPTSMFRSSRSVQLSQFIYCRVQIRSRKVLWLKIESLAALTLLLHFIQYICGVQIAPLGTNCSFTKVRAEFVVVFIDNCFPVSRFIQKLPSRISWSLVALKHGLRKKSWHFGAGLGQYL